MFLLAASVPINLECSNGCGIRLDGAVDYFEIQIPDMDPAPGIERAEVVPVPAAK
jgi:hypothetical protein